MANETDGKALCTLRAYDMGVLSGDTGIRASAELRRELGMRWRGRLRTVAFADTEHVRVNLVRHLLSAH